ncbi:MAG: WD40/YVTN/BNR-like repeat-containing protein [Panacagrimonas sp.]
MRGLGLLLGAAGLCCGAALAQEVEDEAPAAEAPAARGPSPAVIAPKAAKNRLLDVALAGTRLVAVGQQGVILVSDDAKTWKQSASPVGTMLTHVQFTDSRTGWVLGHDATILQSTDGGTTWALKHHDPKGRALYDLLFLDSTHGLAIGAYGTMLQTTDGGASWNARDDALTGLGMHLNALLKLADGSLFIAGERGLMARSTDAAATWTVLDSPYAGSLFGARPQGDKGALVYGMRGNVYTAADLAICPVVDVATWDPYSRETVTDPVKLAASGWRKVESPIRESLFGAIALDSGAALLVGVNGTTLKLDAAATSIAPVRTAAVETLAKGVRFQDRVIAVGRRGVEDLGVVP